MNNYNSHRRWGTFGHVVGTLIVSMLLVQINRMNVHNMQQNIAPTTTAVEITDEVVLQEFIPADSCNNIQWTTNNTTGYLDHTAVYFTYLADLNSVLFIELGWQGAMVTLRLEWENNKIWAEVKKYGDTFIMIDDYRELHTPNDLVLIGFKNAHIFVAQKQADNKIRYGLLDRNQYSTCTFP